jgi:hypothetical protein
VTIQPTHRAGGNARHAGLTADAARMLKALARDKEKTVMIARKLKRTERATYQKAVALGVTLGGGRKKRA